MCHVGKARLRGLGTGSSFSFEDHLLQVEHTRTTPTSKTPDASTPLKAHFKRF